MKLVGTVHAAEGDRPRRWPWGVALGLAASLAPAAAGAHGFGRLYNLPVPFWLYAWAATAVLVVSFLLAAWFAAEPQRAGANADAPRRDLTHTYFARALRWSKPTLQALSVAMLLITIATGLFGSRDPYRNFSMTFFWVVFLLGFTYFTALVGNVWAALNPWRVLAELAARVAPHSVRGLMRYPQWLGDWPALALYLAFVWFELFSRATPHGLGVLLLAYTAVNALGVALVGATAWFAHAEFFSVFLRLVALHSPLAYRRGVPAADALETRGTLHLRLPFAGIVDERPQHLSTVVFALAMLATTAFDGLRATQWWVQLFWGDRTGLVAALAGERPMQAVAAMRPWYVAWETLCLVALPFVYLAAMLAALALAKALTRSARPVRQLALDFAFTLLPIALVYHLTHYATLLLSQGLKILALASDPFGRGWDLFGTAWKFRAPYLPDMAWVWHGQVGMILIGHVVSLVLAHRVAARLWPTRAQVFVSQLPMLLLMVAFTVVGLWILAQPLTVERMR